ncbi:hypothetical protein OIU76_011612 [Salix suchowensis]|uniref:Homeobox domain-containing protein n=1 Tax=Salix suchowensis TaxID=1278906 RepID=A0ABQ8ZXG3_9ROSI|nr:WUSCHEL-related homeobox [Salix suchowensis]KAJ6312680.1 hypothetical protein OIU77_014241 [Salix suchowensis]KAJ6324339.1 hypothetical protein OIU76_011612 [Salix suchowensis]KAJ6324340.1 hypothetical protein OIU76_011612 [Salix suchowensis]KAJ6356752.1 hypothetical protein OIU78_004784 [Salix suchowensis]
MRMINGGDNNEPRMDDFFNPKPNTAATPLTNVGLKHHLGKTSEKSSGGKLKEQAEETRNSRWNPTAAQLLALEEKYRCGIRTPTTDQIQQITSQLRRFGKIEGKNVFYWFQNHKARERKKRRRRQVQQKHSNSTGHESLNTLKETGPRWTILELDQTNNLVPHYSNCSTDHVEGPVSVNGPAIAESGTYGWPEFQERELQQMKSSSLGMHAVWKNMDLSTSTPAHHLTSAVTTEASKFLSLEEHSSLLQPAMTTTHANHDDEIREIQTLQLFPLCSDDRNYGANGQFFDFLPLKN